MVTFKEETHQYFIGDREVPSVSEILRFLFPNKYSNIPEWILSAKARFGTRIHEAIECYEEDLYFELNEEEESVFNKYLLLKEENNIEVVEQETMVHFEGRYGGRLDMVANVNGKRSLIDIKTTAKLDVESLAYQLGLYAMAYGEEFESYYCIHLPKKDIGRLVEITPKSKKELLRVIEEYEVVKDE